MKVNDVQVVRLSEMRTHKSGIEKQSTDLMKVTEDGEVLEKNGVALEKSVEEKSIDLVSVNSDESIKDDDQVSFHEGRLQQWYFPEFRMQLLGSLSGIILLFGCGMLSAWSITDFVKDILANEEEWIDIDYGWNLYNEEEKDFFQSRHIIIAMVVLSWNFGALVGGMFGAFIVPVLPNRAIYTLGSVLMFFTGVTLTKHTSPFYCVKARIVTGFIFAMIQVAVIVQAAESSTKKVRRWMLIVVAYVNALAYLISIVLFYNFDDREQVTYSEDNAVFYIISTAMMAISVIALILNFIFTCDTVPFLLNRGEETKAFKEMTRLKVEHLSMMDVRYEYERIRFDVAQTQLDGNRSLSSRMNYVPLISMCNVRILNLLFNSVPMTLLLIWAPTEEAADSAAMYNATASPTPEDFVDVDEIEPMVHPLYSLAIIQAFRILSSTVFVLKGDKYYFNRFCYKFAFVCGATLVVWYFVRIWFAPIEILSQIFYFPVTLIIMVSFTSLPLPLEVIQLSQSADSYARIQNTWSLAWAIFIENLFHMLLIGQIDMLFGVMFVFFVNGIAMMYFSFWLLKFLPNVVAIHPITVAVIARYPFRHAQNEPSLHI